MTQQNQHKKQTPQLRFPEFKDDFQLQKLSKLTRIYDGTHQTPKYVEEGVPFYSVEHVSANQFEKTKFISEEVFQKEIKRVKLEKGDILMTRIGSIGVSRIIDWDVRASFYVSLALIKGNNSFNSSYLNQFIKSYSFQRELWKRTIHVAFPQKINLGEIGQCLVKLPSLPEQQKIATFLTAVDKRIALLENKKSLLEDYKKGVMQQLFSQQLRFKDENGQVFPDWEEKKLKDVLIEHKTKNKDGKISEVFSVAKNKGVINQIEHLGRSFSAATTLHYKVVFPGDLIYTKSPTKDFPFGIIKQNLTGRTGLVSPLYVVTKPITKSLGFIFHNYFLSWVNVYNYLIPLVQKGAKNTMNINNDEFLNGATFVLPVSEKEQQKIASFLSAIDTKIETVNQQIEGMQQFKKGLLQKMFV